MKKRNSKKNVILSETRIWMEDGEVKTRDLVFESECTDLTPHPTECRVVVIEGYGAKMIWPANTTRRSPVDLKLARVLVKTALKKNYHYLHKDENNS